MVGREMIRSGDLVFYLDTDGDELALLPASHAFVRGGPMPSEWTYDFSLAGPTATRDYYEVPAASVLHFRYGVAPGKPWAGCGPVDLAALSGKLSASTVRSLGYEMAGPIGSLLGIPVDGDDPTVAKLKTDIGSAKGKVALVETGNWDQGDDRMIDLAAKRFGPNPGAPSVELAQLASSEIFSACGYNPSLFIAGDSASLREAYRVMLFGVLQPLGRKIETELTRKLGTVTLEWTELRAADIQARARSAASLVTAGATLESAAREVGFKNIVAAPTPNE